MKTKNFKILNADTDSIMFTKTDELPFSREEIALVLQELNSHFPANIKWEDDGVIDSIVVLKAKNYALKVGTKVKIKGSALKATLKEPALQEAIKLVMAALLEGDIGKVPDLYKTFILEACRVSDIGRWCVKKTITDAILKPKRLNEQKVADALVGTDYSQGDKRYFFFMPDETLCLRENFTGVYDVTRLLEKVYKTFYVFESVIDMSLLPKYHLKRSTPLLQSLINSV